MSSEVEAADFQFRMKCLQIRNESLICKPCVIDATRCVLVSRASAVLESGNRLSCDLAGLLARLPDR